MHTFHIDITEIAIILVSGALLMVPVLGFTLRWALPPILDSMGNARRRAAAQRDGSPNAAPSSQHERANRGSRGAHDAVDEAIEQELAALDL